MTIRVISSTMGVSSPATVSEDAGAGHYKYRKNPDWVPGAHPEPPGDPQPQNATASARKRRRFSEYTRLRLEGKTRDEAARLVGIAASTANYYEREFACKQQRGGDHA